MKKKTSTKNNDDFAKDFAKSELLEDVVKANLKNALEYEDYKFHKNYYTDVGIMRVISA